MPIANCFVSDEIDCSFEKLINCWSLKSGVSEEYMTVNIIPVRQQLGARYTVMVNLQLPSMWPEDKVSKIQLGLVNSLAEIMEKRLDDIHLCTNILDSGAVVENGKVLSW